MIKLVNKNYSYTRLLKVFIILVSITAFSSCEDNTLPDTGDLVDLTPPTANFSYTSSTQNFRTILFTNLSGSASDFVWDFGGGDTSTESEPEHTFANGEGTYPVTLTSTDGNGVSGVITLDVVVVNELIPVFLCPSFECSDRSVWGGGTASSPYSGSGSPTPPDGTSGAKLSANSTSKFLDQTIDVKGATTYQISFWYVSKNSGSVAGNLLIEDATSNSAFINEAIPISATTSTYETIAYSFTTDASTDRLRFYIRAGDVECRYDLVEIKKL
jgi:PKD repeat protein